jgi:GT2 family glycosyltransferase
MDEMVAWPKIYLCMLNWNGKQHLEYAIQSILSTEYPTYELVIVDNASTDGSVAYVEQTFPQIKIILNQKNLGWAGGNNVGIRDALQRGFDWIVLINNDILIDPRWLREAVRAAASDRMIGLVGFNVFGEFKKIPQEDFYAAQRAFCKLEIFDTQIIAGCALMVKAEVFENIGFIDEVYFIYGEEDDFEHRAVSTGYRMIGTNIPLWHYSEGWARSVPLRSAYFAMRNGLRFGIKTRGYGVFEILKWLLSSLRFACSPFVRIDPENALERRGRPTNNPFINGSLVLRAVGWNILHSSESRKIRQEEEKLIAEAHRKLKAGREQIDGCGDRERKKY